MLKREETNVRWLYNSGIYLIYAGNFKMIICNYYKPLHSEKENNVCRYLQHFHCGILWSSSGFYCTG